MFLHTSKTFSNSSLELMTLLTRTWVKCWVHSFYMSWEEAAYSFPKSFDLIFFPSYKFRYNLKTILSPQSKHYALMTK